ncbi:hypothetical protein SAMN05216369_2144 [Marinobacter antarcticus]|uniref:Polysaccharide lyase n=1 Tax=Marinobacter antarcticus TaxID=564117 RepID=A0A1M6SN00_9GAMM|nr:hypothetical protein [Marinobacter antarcticus]SHK46083.1 hypothetical protein SAMN05216369_2144 [Marinobacter antarcticus]
MRLVKTQFSAPFLLAAGIFLASPLVHSEVIFEDNFDDQPDWTSGMYTTEQVQRAVDGDVIPEGYFSARQEANWAPSTGYPDKHEVIEILASNADKARGGTGKSFVGWRKSYDEGWKNWASESILMKYFPEGYDELYVEFWVSFSPDWTRTYTGGASKNTTKLFRISSWNGKPSEYNGFPGGNLGPIALWDYSLNDYGVRLKNSLRGGPHGDNYKFAVEDIKDIGGYISSGSSGDFNLNFSGLLEGMGPNNTQPIIEDRLNGGFITTSTPGSITHDQIYGPGKSWTKMGFYVKMNSAPNATDGIYRQWMNDKQIFRSTKIPWIRSSATENENAKWNLVVIGGNDFFRPYPNEDRYEEWYAIDDLIIRTDIPDYLDSTTIVPPSPPVGFEVE